MRLMVLLGDINSIISRTKLCFTFKNFGDTTSNFVIDRFYAKSFPNYSIYKLQTLHYLFLQQCEDHKEVRYLMVMSQLKINCLKLHFLTEKKLLLV